MGSIGVAQSEYLRASRCNHEGKIANGFLCRDEIFQMEGPEEETCSEL